MRKKRKRKAGMRGSIGNEERMEREGDREHFSELLDVNSERGYREEEGLKWK